MDGESREQRDERLLELFRKLDIKRTGKLDMTDLKIGLAKMNHPLKDADGLIRDMLAACDINHDGQITFDEFVRFCSQTEKELWTLFQTIDRDHNGKLDKTELSAAFGRAGVAVSNARLDRFFSYIDKNHDGKIDFPEWRDFLLFIPTHSPGLKQIFSYYTTTVKLTAEGDVHLSDEALSGLGTTFQFLRSSLFGAIVQIYDPPPHTSATTKPHPTHVTRPPEYGEDPDIHHYDHPLYSIYPNADPHIPIKPARRKAAPLLLDDDSDEVVLVKPKLTDLMPSAGYFAAGGLAGITSRTATAPLDRLKVYLIAQTGTATKALNAAKSGAALEAAKAGASTLWGACKELWAAGGMRQMFAGNGLNVLKVMPESAVKFGSYEASKRAVARWEGHNNPKHISHASQFTAGGLAGMISQAVVYPLDTLKFRTQCETVPGALKGNALVIETARKIWRTTGVRGYYRGLPMGLIGMFPYSAIDLFTFENLKQAVVKRNMKANPSIKHEEDALPSNFSLALMGGFSGAIGASIVYPINLLRTRLQSQGTTQHPRTYSGVLDVTRQTIRGEGWRGLFKGLTPNLLKVVPAVSITYVVYENTKRALHLS